MSFFLEQVSKILTYDTPKMATDGARMDKDQPFAAEFAENRDRRERLFHLANSIYHNPDNIDALRQYATLIISSAGKDGRASPSDVLNVCDQMEGLLLDQARRVNSQYVSDILALAEDLDSVRAMALIEGDSTKEDVGQTSAPEDEDLLHTLRSWQESGLPVDVPTDFQNLKDALDEAREVQAVIQRRDDGVLNGLDFWINRLEATVEVHYVLEEANERIEAALSEDEITEAAYLLQSAERAIQQLVMSRLEVDGAWRSRIHAITRRLEEASQSTAQRKRLRADQRRWNTLERDHSNIPELLSEGLPSVPNTVQRGYSKFTKRIESRETVLRALNRTLSQLQTRNLQQKAVGLIEQLSDQMEELHTRRQQAYNKYALHYIAKALKEGVSQTGVMGDKKLLSEAMITHLGKINRQYLTEEVSRAYSEVFELLYGKLRKAKSKEDFDEPGRKLHLLKRMADRDSSPIDSF